MITDPFLEFLVVDNDDGTETVEKKDSDDYWEKRYHVEENKCPSFLRKMTTEILKAGKYLNVIRECGKDISSVSVRHFSCLIYQFSSHVLIWVKKSIIDITGFTTSLQHT